MALLQSAGIYMDGPKRILQGYAPQQERIGELVLRAIKQSRHYLNGYIKDSSILEKLLKGLTTMKSRRISSSG